jgi:hypothetical protein
MRFVAGLSPRGPGLDPGSVDVRSVDKVPLEYVLLRLLCFFLVSIIPQMLHTHHHVRTTLTRRTNVIAELTHASYTYLLH